MWSHGYCRGDRVTMGAAVCPTDTVGGGREGGRGGGREGGREGGQIHKTYYTSQREIWRVKYLAIYHS